MAEGKTPQEKEGTRPQRRARIGLAYVLLILLAVISAAYIFDSGATEASYDEFQFYLENGCVQSLRLGDDTYVGVIDIPRGFKLPPSAQAKAAARRGEGAAEAPADKSLTPGFGGEIHLREGKGPFKFSVTALRNDEVEKDLIAQLVARNLPFEKVPASDLWPGIILYALPLVVLVALWFMIMRQSGSVGRAALHFGRSRAKLYSESREQVSFEDVAGCDEAKVELHEVVDFLRNPKKYQTLGGRMPKGILLVGPPGTGKTLLARAVAGESGKPFFWLSGSDFVEMFVGVGAARVRDLFQQAKTKAPCIIFVDELDAVGRHRGAGLGGGHDEREQTLNQLLVEMDGFDPNSGVIFLAATNRPDVLDPALLRPGRFDRQVVIDAPDSRGRKAILEIHARERPFAAGIDFSVLAASTPGFTGADLANVINEAALLAARDGKPTIGQVELDEAVERAIAGPERKSRRLNEEERRRVAYHEAGHALVAALSKDADPVRKISIVPRGHAALGYTLQPPNDDRYIITREALLDRLKGLVAGRAAELVVFNQTSTGAHNDLERATEIARSMVCRFGMSDRLGPVIYGREQHQVFLGRDMSQEQRNYSESTAQEIDREVRRLLEEADLAARRILEERRACLDHIAATLLSREVMQGTELDELLKRELAHSTAGAPSAEVVPEDAPAAGAPAR